MNAALPLPSPHETRNGATLAVRLERKYADRITGSLVVPATAGRYAPCPSGLPEALAQAQSITRRSPVP